VDIPIAKYLPLNPAYPLPARAFESVRYVGLVCYVRALTEFQQFGFVKCAAQHWVTIRSATDCLRTRRIF
jgi:hypothetical protein